MNGDIFLAYIEQCLVPTLKPGDIVTTPPQPTLSPDDLSIAVPATESVTAGTATVVTGVSISDQRRMGVQKPGTLALSLWDATGGTFTIAGQSGSSLQPDDTVANLNADLAGMTYTPASGQTSDTIAVDVWNQAGDEAMQSLDVTRDDIAVPGKHRHRHHRPDRPEPRSQG